MSMHCSVVVVVDEHGVVHPRERVALLLGQVLDDENEQGDAIVRA
jgi:hypothetical protein